MSLSVTALQLLHHLIQSIMYLRYKLEPYNGQSTRYLCPQCNHREKTFVRYIDTETKLYVNTIVGRCNRESNCGYHYSPKQYFQDNHISIETIHTRTSQPHFDRTKPVSYIPNVVFNASLKAYDTNNFIKYLSGILGVEVTEQLKQRYHIGTSKYWNGATVFWQIDIEGKIRTGKIMLYNPETGKRIKEPFSHIHLAHKALKSPNFELKQCLFGEHLLIDTSKPVAIVESEKTAIIASIYLPDFIWLATGSLSNLSLEKCKILKGRNVFLFPDLNGYDKWNVKAKEIASIAHIHVSDLLERKASDDERKNGFDIADYLMHFNLDQFKIRTEKKIPPLPKTTPKENSIQTYGQLFDFIKGNCPRLYENLLNTKAGIMN